MHPLIRRVIPPLGKPVLSAWFLTIRMRWCRIENLRRARDLADRAIFAFWHEDLPYFIWSHRNRGVRILISRHRDGQLMGRFIERFGFQSVSGSSTSGGTAALRELVRLAKEPFDFALTPDGPKGPPRRVKPGVIDLASRTGLPIVPASVAHHRAHRIASWDRMALPFPFTRAITVAHTPFTVPPPEELGKDGLHEYRMRLEETLVAGSEEVATNFDALYRSGSRKLIDAPTTAETGGSRASAPA